MKEGYAVVVGVDGSPESHAALRFALEDAARRRSGVQVVSAYVPPEYWAASYGLTALPALEDLVQVSARVGQAAVDAVVAAVPQLGTVPTEVVALPGLRQGLHGWRVTDCAVTLTHSGYWPRQSHAHQRFDKSMSSTAGDFRNLVPLVLADALRQAGTRVHEPVHLFHLEIPPDTLGTVLPVLARCRAVPGPPTVRGSSCVLDGDVPAARVHALQRQLPALTRAEGVLETVFHRHRPVQGSVPERSRTDHNPLDRREYLLHVQRRV